MNVFPQTESIREIVMTISDADIREPTNEIPGWNNAWRTDDKCLQGMRFLLVPCTLPDLFYLIAPVYRP